MENEMGNEIVNKITEYGNAIVEYLDQSIKEVNQIKQENADLRFENDYLKSVIKELLDNGEMARQIAINILKEKK